MSDKELLEFAAKAAGIVGFWEKDKSFIQERYYFNVSYDNQNMLAGFEWNPLTDDGDALRLAVKLKLSVDAESCCAMDSALDGRRDTDWFGGGDDEHAGVSHDECDPYAATRLAIVRAAAEIGKAMK